MTSRTFALFVMLLVPGWAAAQRSGSTVATERIFEAIGVREGVAVCEMGAGDGELSIAAAKIVGPAGRVYASEPGDGRVRALRDKVGSSDLAQITVVAGDPAKANFPDAACDGLFMRSVYHHFGDPAQINASIVASLKPGGRVALRPSGTAHQGMHVSGHRLVDDCSSRDGVEAVAAHKTRPDSARGSAASGSTEVVCRPTAARASRGRDGS